MRFALTLALLAFTLAPCKAEEIDDVEHNGAVVTIDGMNYRVERSDRSISESWNPGDDVEVDGNVIINNDRDEQVSAEQE